MGWITQKSRSGSLRLQDATFAFDPQVLGDIRFCSNIAHQSLRQMGVEIIGYKVPLPHCRIRLYPAMDMVGEVLLIPGWPTPSSHNFTQSDIKVEDKRQSSMPNILELSPLDFSRSHGQPWMFPFQCLNTCHFINAFKSFALLAALGCLLVTCVDIVHLLVKALIRCWRQPITDLMGLEIALFKSLAACRAEIFSTMPLFMISSAISRDVHWLMGRPFSSGFSQASSVILQIWSAVNCAGAPGRGKSSNLSSILRSSSEIACKSNQRCRHKRTVSKFTFISLAIPLLFCPLPAARTIRPRSAICCPTL